jgi:hypothetical protein
MAYQQCLHVIQWVISPVTCVICSLRRQSVLGNDCTAQFASSTEVLDRNGGWGSML